VADCGLPQLLIGQAIIPVIGCIRIGVIERPELVIGKCLIRKRGSCKKIKNAANNDLIVNPLLYSYGLSIELAV